MVTAYSYQCYTYNILLVQGGNDLDDDVAVALNEKETELRNYLLHGESLSEETLEEYSTLFWSTEPYKYMLFNQKQFIIHLSLLYTGHQVL